MPTEALPKGDDLSAATAGTKRRWLASAAGAAIATGIVVFLFRAPGLDHGSSTTGQGKAAVTLNPGRPEELTMRDLTPLFLPTKYNAEPVVITAPELKAPFADPEPKWKFNVEDPALPMPPAARSLATPVEAVADTPGPLAFGIGRTNRQIDPVEPHGAFIEVIAGDTGARVLERALPVTARPPTSDHGGVGWHPLEFLASVDPAGLVGSPALTSSSGVEEVDNYFRNYLARTFRLGDRLSPGFYRVVIGP